MRRILMLMERSYLNLHKSRKQVQNMKNRAAQACVLALEFIDLE